MKPSINDPKKLIGKTLTPNAGIALDYEKAIVNLIAAMARDIKRELVISFTDIEIEDSPEHAMDGLSITPQVRIKLNALLDKWTVRFNDLSKRATKRMMWRTERNADITLGMSLKEISKDLEIDVSKPSSRLKTVIQASTEEAANLIKLIPQKYLADVQGQVMRSITSGNGLQDLVPYLTKQYEGNVNHARLVARDQTRKAYNNIQAAKAQDLGAESFIWVHHASKHPRERHIELDGKEFRFDDPPFIGKMYGVDVYGLPSQLPSCRCTMRLVFNWMK